MRKRSLLLKTLVAPILGVTCFFSYETQALQMIVDHQSTQSKALKNQWPCGEHADLLRNQQGEPIWINHQKLKKHALHQVDPNIPGVCADATIIVDVLIDTEGKVQCTQTHEGHSALRWGAEKAAQQWLFRPFVIKGKKVAVFGRLRLKYKTFG